MWDRIEARLALLELLSTGFLRYRKSQSEAFAWLSELSWTRATTRREEIELVSERKDELIAILDRAWPQWRYAHEQLLDAGLPVTPTGWAQATDAKRADALPDLPNRLNRRTAAAVVAPGAKSALTPSRRETLRTSEVVDDGIVRIRPPRGVSLLHGDRSVPLDSYLDLLGEIDLPDRALRDGVRLEGAIQAVATVENLGAWRDMPRPRGWMLIHVPGWNTSTARLFLRTLTNVPTLHFGDLDPAGIRIYRHLVEDVPDLRLFVPEFWRELVDVHAHVGRWPNDLDLAGMPQLVRDLASTDRWLEQEALVVDQRLFGALKAALEAPR